MKSSLNKDRPVNLDISTIKLPLAAWTSITHRISGVILFFGIGVLLWLFDQSLSGPDGFARVREIVTSPLAKLVVWGVLAALAYHLVAGVKHLLLDLGLGESKEAAPRGAAAVIIVSVILIVLVGAWLW